MDVTLKRQSRRHLSSVLFSFVVLGAFGACGGDGTSNPCSALCACIAGTDAEARSECRQTCNEQRREGATVADCRAETNARGYPQCVDRCEAFASQSDDESDDGSRGDGDGSAPQCMGSSCPEGATSSRQCHSDCDYSGFCWDVCENVLDYHVDNAICSDGLDNDSDGKKDCADPDCRAGASICATGSGGDGDGPGDGDDYYGDGDYSSGDGDLVGDGDEGDGDGDGDGDVNALCVSAFMTSGYDRTCSQCACSNCLPQISNCQANINATWAGQCLAVAECCADAGNLTGLDCYTAGCSAEIEAAGGGSTAVANGACTPSGSTPTNACQAATQYGTCFVTNCAVECGGGQ